MADRLAGRVFIITGAGGGIGAGIAGALIAEGARVALWDLAIEVTNQVALFLDPTGRNVAGFAADVTNDVAVRTATAATIEHFGRLDGLVNNAGIITMAEAWDATPELWNLHMSVNVTGSFNCAKAVGEHLRGHGGGNIVNVSSNCGKAGYRNMAAYNASKAAVIGLTRSLSMEWAEHNINVNAVCPGGVDTPMLANVAAWLAPRAKISAEDVLSDMGIEQLGRKINPSEVGRVVAFLLSDDAHIIRGQSISIDGGETPY
jgi:meso-butanediol dehydrogenase/(S,S)-butanediol dehydrogenase/diacetyl reductase